MAPTFNLCATLALLLLTHSPGALAQDAKANPEWSADPKLVEQLADAFTDSHISFRPTPGMKPRQIILDPEVSAAGVRHYGWTRDGVFPCTEFVNVLLTPFSKPSPDALDKMTAGLIRLGMPDAFNGIKHGRFRGVEARSGSYSCTIGGERLVVYYLVTIEKVGSCLISASIPEAKLTPERTELIRASILTFDRPK